jgi:ABC-2 type transport system ATP-binding protein
MFYLQEGGLSTGYQEFRRLYNEVRMKVLEVDGIVKQFGEFTAVDGISFQMEEGVVFGLLGPNGAGKTTTIRMIMNIIMPDSGRVSLLDGISIRDSVDRIGYLPEERGLYRKMKVGELLLFLSELKSMPHKEARSRIDDWLERLEMTEWKDKKVEELSKGMQQKIQFVGTILHSPRLLILDEPFGGLDPINTNLIKDIILELKAKGTTIIFSTHVMESAEKLCEEIFLINKGKQVLYGRLSEIKKGFGRRNVIIEYDGEDTFLKNSREIREYDNYGNMAEIKLNRDGDPQKLLREAVKSVQVHRFEQKDPSLNDIFIASVKDATAEGGAE